MRCAIRRMLERLAARPAIALTGVLAMLAALAGPPGDAERTTRWLVPGHQPTPAGAQVIDSYAVAGLDVIRSTARPDDGIPLDTPLRWQTAASSDAAPYHEGFVDDAMSRIRATDAWAEGARGDGALVALIDTGVAAIEALDGAVAGEVDFTGQGGGDRFGHGTYMASLIAARGDRAHGVAPEAGILSLKVGDDDGSTDLGTVLAALDWLHGPGRSLGLRVATLAVGIEPGTPAADVLDAATATLSASGTQVITATGNDAEHQTLASPATSPGTLSAGALDGDETAWFSAEGPDRAGVGQPDVLAPGVDVAGHAPPDSVIIAEAFSDGSAPGRLALGQVRGTGTSVAAALTTGVTALASSVNPELDGPELARAVGKDSEGQWLDAREALRAVDGVATDRPPAQELPNGRPRPLHPHTPPDEVPLPPVAAWEPAEWNGTAWLGSSWADDRWSESTPGAGQATGPRKDQGPLAAHSPGRSPTSQGVGQSMPHWNGVPWNGARWDMVRWNTVRWNMMRSWEPVRWNPAHWSTLRWNTVRWNGEHWSSLGYHDDRDQPRTGKPIDHSPDTVRWNPHDPTTPRTGKPIDHSPDTVRWNGDTSQPTHSH